MIINRRNVQQVDAFIAVTNDDEANIMSWLCWQSDWVRKKSHGCLFNVAYVDLSPKAERST